MGRELAIREREHLHVRDGVGVGTGAVGALIIGTSRKPRESSVAEHLLYAGDAEAVLAGLFELVADVVHGEIALAECDDALAHSVLPRLRPRAARNVTEEVPLHVVTEAPA